MMDGLSSRRPYLIRALYEWVLDNNLTPHLLVAADAPGVDLPAQFAADDGRITINISPSAVRGLRLDNDGVAFSARFSGRSYAVTIPPGAVLALYARENGEGMLFGDVEIAEPSDAEGSAPPADADDGRNKSEQAPKEGPPHLRVVK